MTDAEEKAIAEAKNILALHFDAYVITTRSTDDGEHDHINSDWRGSLSDVLGMQRLSTIRIEYMAIHGKLPDL